MKQDRIVGIIFAVINAALIVVCAILYGKADKVEPKFKIEAVNVIYMPGMDETELLEGISANDNRDGDVTDRIVVEKIVENKEDSTAVAYFAVSDKAGNVAKLSKFFCAKFPTETANDQTDIIEYTFETDGAPATEETEEAESKAEEETEQEETEPEETEPDETKKEEDSGKSDIREDTEQDSAAVTSPARTGMPELVLGQSEVTIQAGTNPPWVNIISTMRDDKDNYETLYYNLHVSEYNRNKPGTYPVTVYVEDSDGNKSQTIPFTIIVK